MKKARSLLTAAIALIFILALTAGCGGGKTETQAPPAQKQLTKIRYSEVVRSIFYAPKYVAINKGFFKEEGLDIELTTAQGADKVMTALLSNNAEIGLAGPEATVYVFNQGQQDYAINFAQLTKRDGSFLVGRKAEPDFKWENLKGKTVIGGRPGGVPQMVLEYLLKQRGLQPGKDVNIITNLQFTATAGAFKGGTGDYVALFEPTASMLEKEKAGYVVASIGKDSGEIPYTVFMTRKSYMEKNPEIIQKFTNAVYKGQIWVEKNSPAEIAKVIQPFFPDADLELMAKVIERYKAQDTWNTTPVMENKSLDTLQKVIQAAGELQKPVESDKLITRKFAEKAVESIKK